MTAPRDWDKELADIDKIIASGGGNPAAGVTGPPPPVRHAGPTTTSPDAPRPSGPPATLKRHVFAAWAKGLLGAVGAGGLLFWPYGKSCGPHLYLYLVGVLAVTAAGVWAMRASWTHRRGFVHILGLLVFLLGLGLAAVEILPRVGYAKTTLTWTCN